MKNIGGIAFLGLFFGMIGTTLGGICGSFIKSKSNKLISFILEFAAGLMTSVICFDLIPNSLEFVSITQSIIGIIIGVISMIYCNDIINNKFKDKSYSKSNKKTDLLKVGIIIGIGLAIHNFPEGLAIGSGFEASQELGIALAIAICIHDFPEGVAMALPMKQGGIESKKVIFYTTLSGISTGVGALVGAIIGSVSKEMIGFSLGYAAGAMLYIVVCEIIPESSELYKGRLSKMGNIMGIILGLLVI